MLLLIAVFSGTLVLALWMGQGVPSHSDAAQARLQTLAAGLPHPTPDAGSPEPTAVSAALPDGARPARRGRLEGLQLDLLRAGLKLKPAEYWLIKAVSAAVLGALGWGMFGHWVAGALLGSVGLWLPGQVLRYRQAGRVRRFENQMADALTLIASSLRSGYSFLRATQVVGQEMPDPIGEEFRRVVAESSLGASAEQALGRMVERVPSYDLELVVTAVNIQIQVGGNLAQILDTIAGTIRERVRHQREIAAQTAEGRISALVLIALPPAMAFLLFCLNPDYMKPLFTTLFGLIMLGAAALLQLIGIIWTRVLLRIDV